MPQQTGRPRVILAMPDPAECEIFAEWLTSEAFEPIKISNPAVALNEMQARPFDLLISDFRFAFQDGLHSATRLRKRNPETPTVVVGDPDPGFATRSVGHRAMFLSRPVDRSSLVCTVSLALIDERPVRRSTRKRVNRFQAALDGAPCYVIDVSNEGVRLEIPTDRRSAPPPFFKVRIPLLGVAVIIQRMWVNANAQNQNRKVVVCGGALTQNPSAAEDRWRNFIGTIPERRVETTSESIQLQ